MERAGKHGRQEKESRRARGFRSIDLPALLSNPEKTLPGGAEINLSQRAALPTRGFCVRMGTYGDNMTKIRLGKILIASLVTVYILLVIKTAWVSEDAYITFRPIENFVNGYGMGYNPGIRVQAFTHPLWFLFQSFIYYLKLKLLKVSFNHQLWLINILWSIRISIIVILLFAYWIKAPKKNVILGLLVLATSKAYVDYSTSGLENPLTHLLLVLFIGVFLKTREFTDRKILLLTFLAGLSALNRLDSILFYVPALIVIWWNREKKAKITGYYVLAFLPLISWLVFSLIYFGFAFPNTAYAKLNTNTSMLTEFKDVWYYYLDSLRLDPVTLLSIFLVLGIVFFGKANSRHKHIAIGIVIYLGYFFYIGGDYMSGRFFSAPLVAVATLFLFIEIQERKYLWGAGLVILGIAAIMGRSPIRAPFDYGANLEDHEIDVHGIVDDRAKHFKNTGLLIKKRRFPGSQFSGRKWVYDPDSTEFIVKGTLGQYMYQAGPNVFPVDVSALGDALLARIPLVEKVKSGHYKRNVPEGYVETLRTGENHIADPNLALYYDKLSIILSGDLLSKERLIEIWKFNTGQYDYMMDRYIEGQLEQE